jgi:hypothetical protein
MTRLKIDTQGSLFFVHAHCADCDSSMGCGEWQPSLARAKRLALGGLKKHREEHHKRGRPVTVGADKTLATRLPGELLDKVSSEAKKLGTDKSAIVREALREHYKKEESSREND